MEIFFFGENYPIYHVEENEERIHLHIKSKVHSCKCPKCHVESSSYHSTYERKIQDTPIHCKETWLYINTYKYNCLNEDCDCSTFVEVLPFAKRSQVKTDSLLNMILGVSIFLSNSSASLVLSLIGIKVSADTIKNIYDRIHIVDNPDIEEVGIDDVATRKGHKYATAIYDLKTHNLIALLDGRDGKTLKEWLKDHTKIKLVARDRASAYASAINEVLPTCMQVADRFHLLQNLLDRLKDIFYLEIPKEIFIQNNEILKKTPKKIIDLHVDDEVLNQLNYDNSLPTDENNNEIIFDNKIHDLNSKQYKRHENSRKQKQKLIIQIKNRWNEIEKQKYKTIAKEFNISIPSAKKYINMSNEEIICLDKPKEYKKRKTQIDEYINIIYKMLKDNHDYKTIFSYVIYRGYKGSERCLDNTIYLLNKNNFPENMPKAKYFEKVTYPSDLVVLKRNEILKYILTIDSKKEKDKNIANNIELLKKDYPIINEIEKIFKEFHSIIVGNETEKLDLFFEEYKDSKIKSFCEGIKKDITAVKHAISSNISSGIVEGNNNKFKLIKRIIYGKAKLVNLFRKCYIAFLATNDDFSLYDLL